MKKLAILVMALLMVVNVATMAFATEITHDTDNQGSIPVELTAEAARFSVIVPTYLPIEVAANGAVVTAEENKIVNHSAGAIRIENVEIAGANGWSLVDYKTDVASFKVNEKKLGIQLNDKIDSDEFGYTLGADNYAFLASDWAIINALPSSAYDDDGNLIDIDEDGFADAADYYSFEYDAIVAPQAEKIEGATVANVVFTIGWND